MTETPKTVKAVHSIDRFVVAVPDLDVAAQFFTEFGLDVERTTDRLLLRCCGSNHVWGEYVVGPRKRLERVCFRANAEDVLEIAEQLRSLGAFEHMSADGSIYARAPDGLLIEVKPGDNVSRTGKAPFDFPAPYSPTQASAPRSACAKVKPNRLSHLSLFTDDVDKAIEFYSRALGIRLSDRSGSNVAFMHGAHGSEHHMIAFARSNGRGIHHSSWEVSTLDDVGLGAEQMANAGFAQGWGIGRHVLGSNYFRYVRDPWGSYAEYSGGMDYIAEGTKWQATDHPGEDSFYQWGPLPPEDFVKNYETAT